MPATKTVDLPPGAEGEASGDLAAPAAEGAAGSIGAQPPAPAVMIARGLGIPGAHGASGGGGTRRQPRRWPRGGQGTGLTPYFTGTVRTPVLPGTVIRATEGGTVIADNVRVTSAGTWGFARSPTAGPWTPGTHTVAVTACQDGKPSAPATITFDVAA